MNISRGNRLLFVSLICCVTIVAAQFGHAQQAPLKIGFVDLGKIDEKWDKYAQVTADLKNMIASKRKELLDRQKELMGEFEAFRLKKELLPAEDAKVRQQELTMEAKNLDTQKKEIEKSVGDKQQELLDPLMKELKNAVQAIAQEGNFTFIFEQRVFFYCSQDPELDITDKVIARLNKK